MARVHETIDDGLAAWITEQPMFFVGTAPLGRDGHVNVSPKGLAGSLAVLGPREVAYLDLTGSGVETIAHLRENGRITLMWCAFGGPPRIVRAAGAGRVVLADDPGCDALLARFPDSGAVARLRTGLRSVIVVEVDRIADSCGFGVPRMDLRGERDQLVTWADGKGAEGLAGYRATRNVTSVDGLPGLG